MQGREIKHTCLFARLRPPAKRSSSLPSSSSPSVRPIASVLFSEYPEEEKEKSSVQRRTDVAARWHWLTCRRKSIQRSRPRRRGGECWSSQPGRRRGRGSWMTGRKSRRSIRRGGQMSGRGEGDNLRGLEGAPQCVMEKKQQEKAQWTRRARRNVKFQRKLKQPSDLSQTHTGVLRRNLTFCTCKIWQTVSENDDYIRGGAATVMLLCFRVEGVWPSAKLSSGWGWNSSCAKRRKQVSK